MIVKVQRSFDGGSVLIYNEDRSIMYQDHYNPELNIEPGCKDYCYAHMEGTIIHIDSAAPEQNW